MNEGPYSSAGTRTIEQQIRRCRTAAWIAVVLGIGAAIWGLVRIGHRDPEDLSKLGSYLQGSVASLWSLAAFLFVYVAFLQQKQQILLQHNQMETQRGQFELQRADQQKQLEEQQKQFQLQQKSLTKQNFEASFFQLLNLHHEMVARQHRKFPGNNNEVEGKTVFRGLWLMLGKAYRQTPSGSELERINVACVQLFRDYGSDTEPWLNSIYQILKFVDNSQIEEKTFYASLFRSQLTRFERLLLFYLGRTPYGEKLKPMLEKYSMLANIEFDFLFNQREHRGLYFGTQAIKATDLAGC